MADPEKKLSHPDMLRAVTRFVERERLRNICLLEVEGGVVVQGYALVDTREGWNLALKTQILSHDDLHKLLEEK